MAIRGIRWNAFCAGACLVLAAAGCSSVDLAIKNGITGHRSDIKITEGPHAGFDETKIDSIGSMLGIDVLCSRTTCEDFGVGISLSALSEETSDFSDGKSQHISIGSILGHVRFRFSDNSNYWFAGLNYGRYSEAFTVRQNGTTTRVSGSGPGWGWVLGYHFTEEWFVDLQYDQFTIDAFDKPKEGGETKADIFVSGYQLHLGFRWR